MACGPRSQVSFAAEAMTAAVMPPVAELAEVVIVALTFGLFLRVSAVLAACRSMNHLGAAAHGSFW